MKKILITVAAGAVALALCGTANAATTTGINSNLLTATNGAWYFNWANKSSANHHQPDGIPRINNDYTTAKGGSLVYDGAVRQDNTIVNVGVTVTGFSGFDANNLFASGTEEVIRQDYAGSTNQNGIGVMTEGTNSEEQVNVAEGEYLRLQFTTSISLLGLDFANGAHSACATGVACGGFEVFTLNNGVATSVASGVIENDFVEFVGDGITGNDFLFRALGPTSGSGEQGWYLSALAGDVAAVPLPASILFMIAGLAGIGALRLRRTA